MHKRYQRCRSLCLCAIFAASIGGPAIADEATSGAAALRGLCPDRPLKGAAPCTVDAGHLQLETDFFNYADQKTSGVNTETSLFTNPTLKFGVTNRLDLEANMVPFETVRAHDANSGHTSARSGIGDLYLRTKYDILGNNGNGPGMALYPYIKAPTAKTGIGNGAWEGGLLLPASINLPGSLSLALTPEVDVVQNETGDGRHPNAVVSVGITRPFGQLTLGAEFWIDSDVDPAQVTTQKSLDFATVWSPKGQPNLKLDSGVDLGLNHNTPDVQVYIGATRRF